MTILEALVKLRNDLKLWVANNLRMKVDKEDGKGLSSNDFTDEEKEKLAGISVDELATIDYVDDEISKKAEADHNHDAAYDAAGSANTAFEDSKTYTDNAVADAKTEASNQDAVVLLEAQQSAKTYTDTVAAGKADSVHTHTVANISDLTVTADELNYMDGVTSSVQTQLNGKATSSDLANYLPLTGGTLSGGVDFSGNSKYLSFYDDSNVRRLALWADGEGGNIRLSPPAAYSHYWEIDAYNGNLRIGDSSGNNTYTFKSYADGGRGGTMGNISLATSSSALIGTASSNFNTTIDSKYHSLYLTGSVGSSDTMNLMFDMRYPRAGLSVSQSMAHGSSKITFTVSGNTLTSSGSSNGVSVYGLYYS